mgnify:FL=1|jgi:hypothetical protein
MNKDAIELLKSLTEALNNAYISSWQSTAAWSEELEAANDFLESLENQIS